MRAQRPHQHQDCDLLSPACIATHTDIVSYTKAFICSEMISGYQLSHDLFTNLACCCKYFSTLYAVLVIISLNFNRLSYMCDVNGKHWITAKTYNKMSSHWQTAMSVWSWIIPHCMLFETCCEKVWHKAHQYNKALINRENRHEMINQWKHAYVALAAGQQNAVHKTGSMTKNDIKVVKKTTNMRILMVYKFREWMMKHLHREQLSQCLSCSSLYNVQLKTTGRSMTACYIKTDMQLTKVQWQFRDMLTKFRWTSSDGF